ncbi:MAG: choloylglycine hydrolase [Oscillospiraceae bacterium]|nr:choloylglycine hydrolase [Oscillospiraceae bacterium]
MCTAITYQTKDHYFGRNLDLEYCFDERVTITPRNYPFHFRTMGEMPTHYAMIGMAYVAEGYPLYYEATNEHGLSMAGLNFPGNACWFEPKEGKDNVSPFEFIPWILGQCKNLAEARTLIERINLVNLSFSPELPLSPLHWMVADRSGALTVEQVSGGLAIYENPVEVLTNNPTFDYHMTNLANYMALSNQQPRNCLAPGLELSPYSRGMGAMGLPGDLSSASRFVRAAFVRMNSRSGAGESESISQFFHILGSVAQQRGCVDMGEGKFEITYYSCCCNTDRGIYYYTTYENSRITAVDMHREDLDGNRVVSYPLVTGQQIEYQN